MREANVLDPNVTEYFQQLIFKLVGTEGGVDQIPDGQTRGRMREDSRLNRTSSHTVTGSEQGCVAEAQLVLDEILLETRKSQMETDCRPWYSGVHCVDLVTSNCDVSIGCSCGEGFKRVVGVKTSKPTRT